MEDDIKDTAYLKIQQIERLYPNSVIKKVSGSFQHTTTYEGNKSKAVDVLKDIKTNNRQKLFFDVRNGIAKEIRPVVWYYFATEGITFDEVITLCSHQLYNDYWTEAAECDSFQLDKKQEKTIEVDVVRMFPEGYVDVFKRADVRVRMRRIKRMYEHYYPNPGYFQGFGDIVTVFFVIFCEYYMGKLTVENLEKTSEDVLKITEAATYTLVVYLMNNVISKCPIQKEKIEFHPESLWRVVVTRLGKEDPDFASNYDDNLIVKQQVYGLLVCFFARQLSVHNTCPIYDQLISGTICKEANVFSGIVSLVVGFVKLVVSRGGNLDDLISFDKQNKGFFKSVTPSDISALIASAWNY
ncbi:hypothetical protein EIN_059460 [Entamoeba invadens IP1]|uniref:hypothetical protein n=1 Tax=Entamoeba invadens IP1 TaxID=370355 RepID=UPI0002C3E14A|nr:hypothetical protein EIN_059460 [Entamoeba invadens IP1]ELP93461.1 hypothetical protein EIN_059460 [Entamoeba invadens IP1]|eukprot:XP_004260232.1 hypothetical protein EIN_059460 [Entamoeba invadens IP1]